MMGIKPACFSVLCIKLQPLGAANGKVFFPMWTHQGLFWMQRMARLKAMFLHSSSDEPISLCRSFCKQWHSPVSHAHTPHLTPYLLFVVGDSRWSTGWSPGSSSTSHPPLSTLPKHLQHTRCVTNAHSDTGNPTCLTPVAGCFVYYHHPYPPRLLLSTSSSGTWSYQQRSARPRPICWQGAESWKTCRLWGKKEQEQSLSSDERAPCENEEDIRRLVPSRSSGATSAEELFTGSVSPARRDLSWTRSGFSAHRTLERQGQKNHRSCNNTVIGVHGFCHKCHSKFICMAANL